MIVASGGTTFEDEIWSGGTEIVQSGGSAHSASLVGGTMEIMSGGSVDHVVMGQIGDIELSNNGYYYGSYSGGSLLVLDASTSFHGTVAGFADLGRPDEIDLRDIAFGTKRFSMGYNRAGSFVVTDGVHTTNFNLLVGYIGGGLVASNDGYGGTLITFTSATATTGGHGHG